MQHIGAMLGHQITDRSTGTKKYKVLFGTHDECKNIEIGKKNRNSARMQLQIRVLKNIEKPYNMGPWMGIRNSQ
jgi:hypothetical protein